MTSLYHLAERREFGTAFFRIDPDMSQYGGNTVVTRRQFLATTTTTTAAAAAGSILLSRSSALAATERIGKTDHFWYRLAPPDGPHIASQRDNKAFAFGDGKVLLSEDNAKTWRHSAPFVDAANVMFSSILASGNIVFATRTKIYVNTDNLKTYRELTVKGRDGRPYLPHTPRDPNKPGSYFYSIDGIHTFKFSQERWHIYRVKELDS